MRFVTAMIILLLIIIAIPVFDQLWAGMAVPLITENNITGFNYVFFRYMPDWLTLFMIIAAFWVVIQRRRDRDE